MSSIESRIQSVQNLINQKQTSFGTLVLDKLVVHEPIDVNKLNVTNLRTGNLEVTGTANINALSVRGQTNLNGNVTINGSLTANGPASFNSNLSTGNLVVSELRNVTIKGWLKVESTITAGGEIRGSRIWSAVWN